jgi:sucrose-6-phosphate hydrolase SacC (GH32 family)
VVRQISPGNRDPKVTWYAPTQRWIMTLYVEWNKTNTIHFLSSPDLKQWSLMSQTAGFFECPDFFELPVDGDRANRKWVLTAGNSDYQIGSFDGTNFTAQTPKLQGQRGRGFYAAQTYSDIAPSDGRRIQIGWFQTPTPGMPFNQSMTLPMELKLTGTPEGPRLTWTPVQELVRLRGAAKELKAVALNPGDPNPFGDVKLELVELRAEFEPTEAREVSFNVRGATITYDATKQELAVNDLRAPAPLRQGRQRLVIYCDRMGLEVFASDGLTYIPMPFIPQADDLSIAVRAGGGTAKFTSLRLYELKSAWKL